MKKNFIQQNKLSVVNTGAKQPTNRTKPNQKPITMPEKIKALEGKVERLELGNGPIQQQILIQIKKIKQELHQLKIGLRSSSLKKSKTYESLHEEDMDHPPVQPPVQRNRSGSKHHQDNKSRRFEQSFKNNSSNRFQKELMPLSAIQPFLKDFKFEGGDQLAPFYYGYNKKTSKPVIVKYSKGPMNQVIQVYNKLWKNIVKARWPCINRIYQAKETDVNVLVMDRNVIGIRGVPFDRVLIDILKILEFIHQSGYLYRNVQPQHFMINEQQRLVVIDFKNARRYLDHKGNHMQVVETVYKGGDFGSNNQLRFMPEGRKDDLESLGYLALFLMTEELPWQGMSRQQMIKCRNSLTLQQLYKRFPHWLEYMVIVHKMAKNQKPDYQRLISLLESAQGK